MYIYFDRNGTIKEVINDESIRKGSSDYNKIYCYLEGNPDIDDIWYLQKNPDGTLTNEVSFVDNIVTKSIPYDSKRDMKYFQDFEEYKFYVFTLSSSYLSQNGLVVATIRVAENNTLWALGELTFNVQANIVNSDNDITQSQYDYLLLTISSYYSKTEIDNKLDLKADKSDTYTKAQTDNLLNSKADKTYVDNSLSEKADKSNTYTKSEVDSKLDLKADKSDTYTKQEVNEKAIGIVNYIDEVRATTDTLYNETQVLRSDVDTLQNDVDNLKSVQNVVEVVATYSALQSYDTSKLDVEDKVQVIADETHDGASTIYNWDGSAWIYVGAYGTNTYTKEEVDTKLSTKADKDDVYTKQEEDTKFEEVGQMFETVGNELEKKVNAEYICKGTAIEQVSYSNTNPSKSAKVVIKRIGGMSYKVNGTIQHSAVYAIWSMNGNNIYNNLSIPSEIQNLTGYGWGINDYTYNYIDFVTKQFVQMVGSRAYQSGDESNTNVITDGITTYYKLIGSNQVITDISSYITKDTLDLAEGGKLEFKNTYNQAVKNAVEYIFNAVTSNNIVDSNGNANSIATKDDLNGYIKDNDTTYSATVRGKEVVVSAGEGYGSTTYKLNSIQTSAPRKPTCDYSFPDEKSGTLALTSDIHNPTITFTQGGTTKGSISLNQSTDQTIDLDAGGGSGGGSTVVANPTLSGDEATLNGLEVDGTKYKVGGSGGKLYLHKFRIRKANLNDASGSKIGTKLYLFYSIVTSSNEPITFDTFMNITHFDGYGAHFGTNVTGDITIDNTMRAINSFSSYSTNDRAEIGYIDNGAVLLYTNCVFDSVDIMNDTITEV